MVPWWDVCSGIDHSNQHNGGYSDEEYDDMNEEGEQEHADLGETLRRLCSESAELLRGAVANCLDEMDSTDDTSTSQLNGASSQSLDVGALRRAFSECIESDLFTGEFVAKVIGSFEQNVIGIRARHPLCNDMLFGVAVDRECDVTASGRLFRRKHQRVLLKCLDESGLFEDDIDDGNEDASAGGDGVEDAICRRLLDLELSNGDEEVPSFDGGDDMDRLFTPLDGTAVFSLACKMNHSCAPNVLVRYRCGWGEHQPLVLQCIALRDIDEGEELCISYIRSDGSLEERREALQNYGFRCECSKCKEDSHMDNGRIHPQGADDGIDENSLFGSDSENGYEEDDLFGSDSDEGDAVSDSNNVRENTCSVDERCDSIALSDRIKVYFQSNVSLGAVPVSVLGSVLSFLVRECSLICKKIDLLPDADASSLDILSYMSGLIEGASQRHLRACGWYGQVGECICFSILQKLGAWPDSITTESYGCFALAASLNFANQGMMIDSSRMLDKAMILSPLIAGDVQDFVRYVRHHASEFLFFDISPCLVDDFSYMTEKIYGISLRSPPMELEKNDFSSIFFFKYVEESKPLVIRGFASSWGALDSWKDLNLFIASYGHRLVPIEVGSMSDGTMKEELMTISDFFETFMIKSRNIGFWDIQTMQEKSSFIAYLAQFRIFDHIPELVSGLEGISFLQGGHIEQNAWIGTGGTRTPLHFDSYDNILVQVVGVKYVRLYNADQSNKLYVINANGSTDKSFCRQGNFSAVNCEFEDTKKHPLCLKATYMDTILYPGDALFIPAGCW
eukprot:CAMPEP_0116031374 /NCGR_PEP_ID=MMETSP0321-20121206/17470_1 /TAXON_ID=163516 /ORGANISM="Leptocylindrus danicus var. danicus, Strain B650" /LENGTH=791 /DNA_ID=CAMNT_0003506475 /DNA_START=469 /DNA_END=2842 /DNA_ORIENTATION=-